jgi:hypothetical protein
VFLIRPPFLIVCGAEFKYLRMTLTNENCIDEEIKSRLNLGILATMQFRIVFSLHLLSITVKIKIFQSIILSNFVWM